MAPTASGSAPRRRPAAFSSAPTARCRPLLGLAAHPPGRRPLRSSADPERGAAVVEFVLVGVLLLALFMGIAQVGLYLHMRNVVVASLAEGAREAANADRDCADGVARARDLVRDAIGDKVADGLTFDVPPGGCETTAGGGAVVVRIRAHGPLPLLFPPIGSVGLSHTAHAFKEGQ